MAKRIINVLIYVFLLIPCDFARCQTLSGSDNLGSFQLNGGLLLNYPVEPSKVMAGFHIGYGLNISEKVSFHFGCDYLFKTRYTSDTLLIDDWETYEVDSIISYPEVFYNNLGTMLGVTYRFKGLNVNTTLVRGGLRLNWNQFMYESDQYDYAYWQHDSDRFDLALQLELGYNYYLTEILAIAGYVGFNRRIAILSDNGKARFQEVNKFSLQLGLGIMITPNL